MSCRLSLFGPPTLLDRRGRPIPVPAKMFALAVFLILSSGGGPAKRTSIRQFLWPSADAKTAAANLRKFLARVRERQEEFGFELIHCERNHVELSPSADIDLDFFLKTVAARCADDLLAICDIYRGDLLEGMAWQELELSEWIEVQRTKLRDTFVGVVSHQLESRADAVGPLQRRIAARKLIEVDPYNETGHRNLMRLFADEREPARVREIYINLRQRLRDDLGVEPDTTTSDLYHSLLAGKMPAPPFAIPASHADPSHRIPAGVEDVSEGVQSVAVESSSMAGVPKVSVLPPPLVPELSYHHHLAVSLVEDVAIGLCRFRGLTSVAPHTSAEFSLGGKKALLQTFGIDYAVETQLHDRGGEIWLAVKLLDTRSRKILWADQYAFNRETIARQYQELSARIVLLLMDRIERTELARYEVTQNSTAYLLYLRGQRYLRALDLPNARRARREFKAAVNACPDFVPAISGLARTYQLEWLLLARGETELLAEAERLARLSIDIDPDDARGFRELGACTLYTSRFDESLEALRNAEERNPQFADLLMDYTDALVHACEPVTALQKIERAIELNPLCPDSYWWAAGGANYQLQDYQAAIRCLLRMRDQTPANRLLAASHAMLGERETARDYVRRANETHPDFSVSGWLSIVPLKDRRYADLYEQGLREAGFV